MIYLNDANIKSLGSDWNALLMTLSDAVFAASRDEFAQPIKPYLRYKDLTNRIIAMPAYLGGQTDTAGIKWIASFPGNLEQGIQRAHSVTVLNEAATGKPLGVLNTTLISAIRTAGVTGLIIKKYLEVLKRDRDKLVVGIIGYGPIGQLHHEMVDSLWGDRIAKCMLYDLRPITHTSDIKVEIANSWQEIYEQADIFITCTTSYEAYIDVRPPAGSLQLDVSLRDYKPSVRSFMDHMIVDDWDEVCRENTDIERMYLDGLLKKEETVSIVEFITTDKIDKTYREDQVVMFNPMGMAIFDIAVGHYYLQLALQTSGGTVLED